MRPGSACRPAALALAIALLPMTATADVDRENCDRLTETMEYYAKENAFSSRYDLAEKIQQYAGRTFEKPFRARALWQMSDAQFADALARVRDCRDFYESSAFERKRSYATMMINYIDRGLPELKDWRQAAQETLAARAALAERVDRLLAQEVAPARVPELMRHMIEIAGDKTTGSDHPSAQNDRIMTAVVAEIEKTHDQIAGRPMPDDAALETLHAEMAPWLTFKDQLDDWPQLGATPDVQYYRPLNRLIGTFGDLRREGAETFAGNLIAAAGDDLLARDRAAQAALGRDWAHLAELDPFYHRKLTEALAERAGALRARVKDAYCDRAIDANGLDEDTLRTTVVGTRRHPTVSLATVICSIGQHGFDVAYAEASGWFSSGFTLTVTPAVAGVEFRDAEPFETLELALEADGAAGPEVHRVTSFERDGASVDLSIPGWKDMLHRLDTMSIGPSRHE